MTNLRCVDNPKIPLICCHLDIQAHSENNYNQHCDKRFENIGQYSYFDKIITCIIITWTLNAVYRWRRLLRHELGPLSLDAAIRDNDRTKWNIFHAIPESFKSFEPPDHRIFGLAFSRSYTYQNLLLN